MSASRLSISISSSYMSAFTALNSSGRAAVIRRITASARWTRTGSPDALATRGRMPISLLP